MSMTASPICWSWEGLDWIPERVRAALEDFYEWHGAQAGWKAETARVVTREGAPGLGEITRQPLLGEKFPTFSEPGRFVFMWGNIGRVVHEDGSFSYVSVHKGIAPTT